MALPHLEQERIRDRERYRRNPGPKRAAAKRWAQANREKKITYNLKRYGLTPAAYDALWEKQGRVCAGCGIERIYSKRHHVDHDHRTGKVRGILCHYCNVVLGQVFEDPQILRSLIQYLERTNGV